MSHTILGTWKCGFMACWPSLDSLVYLFKVYSTSKERHLLQHIMVLSLNEHAQIMKEVGMSPGGTTSDTTKIHFIWTVHPDTSQRWEKIAQRAIDGWLTLGRYTITALVPMLQKFTAAASVSLVLYGSSHLIASLRGNKGRGRNEEK